MADFTHLNLRADVTDMAAASGMEGLEARFASGDLELRDQAISLQRLHPGVRQPFGHRHASQEEVYVVVEGAGRAKLGDEVVDLATWDAFRVAAPTWRCLEAGPDGLTFLAIGVPPMADSRAETEMDPDFWTD
jgi:gentisate 1,2-dioxygenase